MEAEDSSLCLQQPVPTYYQTNPVSSFM